MNANPMEERSPPIESVARQPATPTPVALRPASGLVLGVLLSAVFWLALLVFWLVA